jgi:hypothetical protein
MSFDLLLFAPAELDAPRRRTLFGVLWEAPELAGFEYLKNFCIAHSCRMVDPQHDAEEFISLTDDLDLPRHFLPRV